MITTTLFMTFLSLNAPAEAPRRTVVDAALRKPGSGHLVVVTGIARPLTRRDGVRFPTDLFPARPAAAAESPNDAPRGEQPADETATGERADRVAPADLCTSAEEARRTPS